MQKSFEQATYALRVGELSEGVLPRARGKGIPCAPLRRPTVRTSLTAVVDSDSGVHIIYRTA